MLHHVGVAGRDGLEEVAALGPAPVGQPGLGDARRRALGDVRRVEHDALRAGVLLQDRAEQVAVPAADVDDRAERREVVGLRDGRRLLHREPGHPLVEHRRLVGVLGEVVERLLAEHLVERGPAGADGLEQLPPRPPAPVRPAVVGDGPHRPRHAGPQDLGQRRLAEPAVRVLGEHADARQRPQHAVQARRVRAGLRGEVGDGLRAGGERVGDAELGGDGQGHRDPLAEDHLGHDRLGRRRSGVGHGIPPGCCAGGGDIIGRRGGRVECPVGHKPASPRSAAKRRRRATARFFLFHDALPGGADDGGICLGRGKKEKTAGRRCWPWGWVRGTGVEVCGAGRGKRPDCCFHQTEIEHLACQSFADS